MYIALWCLWNAATRLFIVPNGCQTISNNNEPSSTIVSHQLCCKIKQSYFQPLNILLRVLKRSAKHRLWLLLVGSLWQGTNKPSWVSVSQVYVTLLYPCNYDNKMIFDFDFWRPWICVRKHNNPIDFNCHSHFKSMLTYCMILWSFLHPLSPVRGYCDKMIDWLRWNCQKSFTTIICRI